MSVYQSNVQVALRLGQIVGSFLYDNGLSHGPVPKDFDSAEGHLVCLHFYVIFSGKTLNINFLCITKVNV